MKAVEFQSILNSDHTMTVPEEVARTIPPGTDLRVLVLIAENGSDAQWEHLAALEFGQGYADSDAIYDKLSGG